jgi:hypothetical protein
LKDFAQETGRELDGPPLALTGGMDTAEFDRLVTRVADPTLIPSIYNYCDRRCERCRFGERCLAYRESQERRAAAEAAAPTETLTGLMSDSVRRTMDIIAILAAREGIDLTSAPNDADLPEDEARWARCRADPLVVLAERYAFTTWPIVQALRPIVLGRGDAEVIEAVNTIEWFCSKVASKTCRAVYGLDDPEQDPNDLQRDANGSAKVARLIIGESRRAWQVLMEVGRAAADGVPARLVQMLDDLDRAIANRFPRAMEFVRPGFDDDAAASARSRDGKPYEAG